MKTYHEWRYCGLGGFPRNILLVTTLLFGACSSFATAQTTSSFGSLHDAVEAAWTNDPAQNDLAVQESGARKRERAAKSWFAGGPSIDAQYYDDRPSGRNYAYRTTQVGLSVPLWLPGQGTATEDVARSETKFAQIQREVAHMAIAIRVTDAVGALQLAQARKAAAQTTLSAFRRIANAVDKSVRSGESTSSDLQAVKGQMGVVESEVNTSVEDMDTSQASLDILTGHPTQASLEGIDVNWPLYQKIRALPWSEERDPRLREVHQKVLVATEKDHLAARSYMPNPEIGAGVINQGQYGSPWDTQIGVSLRMPIPTDVTRVPVRTQAQSALSTAMREETDTRRAILAEVARVQARLRNTSASVVTTAQAAHDMQARADAVEKSWRAGETPLIEALRARMDAYDARLRFNTAETGYRIAIVRAVIAWGYLP
ncbi:MAG: TolC family protein [Gluconobacter cerinus]|uniref:TolC family protein n=1 Tax=Gluconobacter cerinus TaxID=38307 RepID=UPI0039EAC00F